MKSKLSTRLLYYFTGFGIGILFVIFFFQNRGCSWTPNNRVKQAIVDRVVVINDDFQKEMNQRGITEKMIKAVIEKGDIDFKNSQKESTPKIYTIYNDKLKLNFSLPENSFISEVSIGYGKIKGVKNSTQGKAKLFLFPNDKKLIYVDSITTMSPAFNEIGNPTNQAILKALKKDGKIDFEKTDFAVKQGAQHYLTCTINGYLVGVKSYWYKDKINIYDLKILVSNQQ